MDNERLEYEYDRAERKAKQRAKKRERENAMPVHGRSLFVLQTALAKRVERSNVHPSIDVKRAIEKPNKK